MTTVRKWFWFWDFDKEEQWLNEMVVKGLCLSGRGFCRYDFEDCAPGEYQIRTEVLEDHDEQPHVKKYIQFVEETGAEKVAFRLRTVYFRKKTADGPFELYSDLTSRLKYVDRVLSLMLIFGPISLIYTLRCAVSLIGPYAELILLLLPLLAVNLLCTWCWWKLWQTRKKLKARQQIHE